MIAVAGAVPAMTAEGEERLRQAMVIAETSDSGPDFEQLIAKRDELLALA
jgi:beta-N-acetylhexosaminidase